MDMRPTAYDRGHARDQAAGPGTLGPSVAAPTPTVSPSLSHRLNVAGPGPDRAHRAHRRRRPPDRVRAWAAADWPECSAGHLTPALQFHGLVEFGNRLVTVVLDRRGRRRLPGLDLPCPAPARPRLAERRAGRRRPGPGGPRRHRRLHQAQPLRRHGALLRHHAAAGRRRRPGAPLHPRLHARVRAASWCHARSSASTTALLALLAVVIAAGTATTGAGPHAGDTSGQQVAKRHPDRAARHGRAPLEPGPAPDRRHHRPRRRRCTWATSPSGSAARRASSWS